MTGLNLQNVTLEGEVIVIDDTASFNAIGDGVVLRDCEIRIAVPSRALSITATIVGGTIHAKRELHGFDWFDARLDGVTFKGRYKNNRFGNFPPMGNSGTVANCDFSGATLRDILFVNTRCSGVSFGVWPQFTISNGPEFHASVATLTNGSDVWEYFEFLADYISEYGDDSVTLNFMTLNAKDISKTEGFDIDHLLKCVQVVDGIVY